MSPGRSALAFALVALAACAPRYEQKQTMIAGQARDLRQVTPDEVARAVQVTFREGEVVFQAPPIESSKIIDLSAAGKEVGLKLGKVERIRIGYLFGVLDRQSGALEHFVLFQSNFIQGATQYASVTLSDGTALPFTVARVPDPCVPNCFPVTYGLVAEIQDAALRAQETAGLPLTITLDNGSMIRTDGQPAYVAGYLQAVDAYRRQHVGAAD
ncbi:MAG: hypothetical protein AB7V27_01170 [Candidatus Binatia bacterium]